jgi:hypothetical protein
MPRAFFSESITTNQRGPLFIGAGLVIILAAQLWPTIPLAAAITLIGLGATLTLKRHHHNELLLVLNFAIYASLVALAITAQMNLHNNLLTQCDAILAIILIVGAIPRLLVRGIAN